ncbi:MAG: 50S ribosomal protein L23 [Bacteroidales bacterium]|nr:50S ribosomal protein L23 [Bacteroidales bacterium]MDD7724949.1 50S ribosomal protein L23 [Bacteroidales bacterium]MDY4174192.1 50S ribosomal protein L23 [Bacteroidales bacterium]
MGVIVKPLVTEKMTKITEKMNNRYGFIVLKSADKPLIKRAVEQLYDVKVVKVNTLIAPAKKRNRYTKAGVISGSVPSYKKAIVTLAEGNTIDFYSNI